MVRTGRELRNDYEKVANGLEIVKGGKCTGRGERILTAPPVVTDHVVMAASNRPKE